MRGKVYLALYKGDKSGKGIKPTLFRLLDRIVRLTTRGPYSHCEIAICLGRPIPLNAVGMEMMPDPNDEAVYECYSASLRDGGVRQKTMPLPAEKWDLILIDTSGMLYKKVLADFKLLKGRKYDWFGALGVLFKNRHDESKWFCSEFCARIIGFQESWRYSPNDLADIVSRESDHRRVMEKE